eukprot:TRINITY_DN625_c0_g1_i14.p1 TRINITY_DN625_c0_g1~~TRINITY_DN625_c0_g1_i14.p1  ORF type:complete len:825 (+),score=228.24 TRINITY_DN625_c0_g1_i14:533-3007(+)
MNGIIELSLNWILKSILSIDDNSRITMREISDAVLQSLNPGYHITKSEFTSNFNSNFSFVFENILVELFPNQKLDDKWKLKITGANFLPHNLKLKWVYYFEFLTENGNNIEDLVKSPNEEDEDDLFFQELIKEKRVPIPVIDDVKSPISFSRAREKWKSFDKEIIKKSLENLNKVASPEKHGILKSPIGSQKHSSGQEKSISRIVDVIKNLFAGDLNFGVEVLSLNKDFKKSVCETYQKYHQGQVDKKEIIRLESQVNEHDKKLKLIKETLHNNLETIYGDISTSENELNKIFSNVRNLVHQVCPEFASCVVPQSKSTLYRKKEKEKEHVKAHEDAPTFIEFKNNEMSFSKNSEKPRKKKKQKEKKPKKKLTPKQTRRKESIKKREAEKRKKIEQAELLAMEKVEIMKQDLKRMEEFIEKMGYGEEVKETKKRACSEHFLKFDCRIITNGHQPKKAKRLDILHPTKVAVVSAQKDATHIVVLDKELTKRQEGIYENTKLPMMNRQWYDEFARTGIEPDSKDKKYIYKETEQKVATNTVFESSQKTAQEEEAIIDQNDKNDSSKFVAALIPLRCHLQNVLIAISPFVKKDQKTITTYLDIHGDASSFLSQNTILNNAALSIKGQNLTTGRDAHSKPRPYLIVLGEEKKELFKTYNRLIGYLIGEAISEQYNIDGIIFEVKLRFINGDNKAIWAILSNNCGGHKRCWGCSAPFDNENIRKNLFLHEYNKFKKKGPKENFEFFIKSFNLKWTKEKTRNEMNELGLQTNPYFLEALYFCLNQTGKNEDQFIKILEGVQVGIDNLHNIRGWILYLISCLKNSKRLSEKM